MRSPRALRHLLRRAKTLKNATGSLRFYGMVIFCHFFVLLPVVYYFHIGTVWVLVAVAYGYLLCFCTAVMFYCLHKRLLPGLRAERWKGTLFTAFLPWHAMRSADAIVGPMTKDWDGLVLLVSGHENFSNKKALQQLWRRALYDPSSQLKCEEVAALFQQAGMEPSEWTSAVTGRHCPICETTYEEGIVECADCTGISLVER